MCNIWTGDEVTCQAPCPRRSSFICVMVDLQGLAEIYMFCSDISQDWEVWTGGTVCWNTWKPFFCSQPPVAPRLVESEPPTWGYSVKSVTNQSLKVLIQDKCLPVDSPLDLEECHCPGGAWWLKALWHEEPLRPSWRHFVAVWCPWWNPLSAGTAGLDITVPGLKNHGHIGFVFVSVVATALVVTAETKEINYWAIR